MKVLHRITNLSLSWFWGARPTLRGPCQYVLVFLLFGRPLNDLDLARLNDDDNSNNSSNWNASLTYLLACSFFLALISEVIYGCKLLMMDGDTRAQRHTTNIKIKNWLFQKYRNFKTSTTSEAACEVFWTFLKWWSCVSLVEVHSWNTLFCTERKCVLG